MEAMNCWEELLGRLPLARSNRAPLQSCQGMLGAALEQSCYAMECCIGTEEHAGMFENTAFLL